MLNTFEIDQRARKCLLAAIPDDWTLTPPTDDIGLDYWVQITKSGSPTSMCFFIQLKGTTCGKIVGDHVVHSISMKKVEQYIGNPLPILFVVCHISQDMPAKDVAYFCWFRDFAEELFKNNSEQPTQLLQQQTVSICIPINSVLTREISSTVLLSFLEIYHIRHVTCEENQSSFMGECKDVAESLQGCDEYFLGIGIDPEGDQALEIKKLAVAGFVLAMSSRHREAISFYEAANSIRQMPDVLLYMSYSFGALGDHVSASTACSDGIKIDPENSFLWSNLGTALFRLGQLFQAMSCHERAASLDGNCFRHWANLGATLEFLASTQEGGESRETLLRSLDAFDKAIKLDSSDSFVFSDMGLVLSKLYRFPQAIDALNKAVLINPKCISGWTRLAHACLSTRDYERAEEAVRNLNVIGIDNKEVRGLASLIEMNKHGEKKDSWSRMMDHFAENMFKSKEAGKK